ncbi:hypothetical protein IMSHALPRED_007147 [Imshaugia aleurites]|uniref:C2H2-type domain-containing protein n=1 Tax=Imshaugia aleurites TaxID=172621 RepID=A0A8H3ITI6_9LECA|nr:hypothetical protein IMSHALPRED_007147 [Imshaugia aleurites]
MNECKHHEPCESQHRIATTDKNGAPAHTVISQPTGGKTSASGQSILNRKGSVQSGSCPDPGCQLSFPDFDKLYEHYVASHPLCIVYRGHSKPFKCPFCHKRYQHDRFVPGHVRSHKPKSLKAPGMEDAKVQEALIRQSHIALANRESQLRTEAPAKAEQTSSDEEEAYSIPKDEGEEDSTNLKDGFIYLDGGIKPEYPIQEQSDNTNVQESPRFGETMPIGLVLQSFPTDPLNSYPGNETPSVEPAPRTPTAEPEVSDSMDLDDDYPERFALDDDELPSSTSNTNASTIAAHYLDGIFHQFEQRLSVEIVRALQMQHFVNVSEVTDLFTFFLDENQRIFVLEQLASINTNQKDSSILEALHGTVFKALIDGWVDFKRLAIRFAPQLIIQANAQKISSGKSVTLALLQYCLNLEALIYRKEINIARHFLRHAPLDDFALTIDIPFPRLVVALAERVKNRTVHDVAIVFTNEMILREMGDYVTILQMIFRPLYPVAAGHEQLWRELRLL